MGWLFTDGATRRQVIDRLTEDQSKDGRVHRTLKKCLRGNTMYALHETGPEGATKKWICVYLLARDGNYGWGYKDVEETCGPVHQDCPVQYLDECDEPGNQWAKEWREACRARAALRASRKPKMGETWMLSNGQNYRIISLRPLRGVKDGTTYKIPRRMLREKVEAPGNDTSVRAVS